jgi:hypothetical protein
MSEQHTPAPWYAMTAETGGFLDQATVFSEHETDGEPTYIADTMPIDNEVPLTQRKANARLIAAAPDLLAALQAVIAAPITGDHESIQRRDAAFTAAGTAIAKATGSAS